MKYTSKCIFNLSVFLFFSFIVKAQEQSQDTTPVKTERYGIRMGVDAFRLGRTTFDKNYKGLELVADYRLTKNYYLAGEIGNENYTKNDDRINFTTKGSYFKIGFDYNLYENWLDMENTVYIGLRYGVSTMSQTVNSYRVYNTNPYFGEAPVTVSGEKFDGLSAQWAEVVLGMKAELFSNLYAGFSVRFNRLFSNQKPKEFDNLYIPGFNRTYNGNFGVGFNYTLTYFVPIYKKKMAKVKSKKE